MAELLVFARNNAHPNPVKDARGCYKIGYIVEIRPDGCIYGSLEGLPTFYKIKIPLISVDHPILLRLMAMQQQQNGFEEDGITPRYDTVRRRRCWLQHINIPQGAKDKLASTGELIIKASPAYTGEFDYTWTQVKNYFWDNVDQANTFTDELA